MTNRRDYEPSRGASAWRAVPLVLFAAGVLVAAWALPVLLRAADYERTERSAARAVERLAKTAVLADFNAAMRDIARATEPSVVHVSVAAEARGRLGTRDYTQSGSGWIWDNDGHVVTNAHVVDGASALEVQLNDGSLRRAELLGLDLRTDIAVLRVDPESLHPAARSQQLPEQGDLVFAFGSPFEFRFSMSSGIVSGIGRSAGLAEVEYENFIQVDAAINPGNSGGPLVDVSGKVIGMNTAIATGRGSTIGSGQFAGIGLAIPMQIVENIVGQLIEHGTAAKGFLGVSVDDVSVSGMLERRLRNSLFGVIGRHYTGEGAIITLVNDASPAARAGLHLGDVIVSIGGRRITSRDEVMSQIGTSRPGTVLPIEVWRPNLERDAGDRLQVNAEVGTRGDPTVSASPWLSILRMAGLEELSDAHGNIRGVRVGAVRADSALTTQIPADSVITEVDGQSVASLDDVVVRLTRNFSTRVRLIGQPKITLTVRMPNGAEREVDVQLPAAPQR